MAAPQIRHAPGAGEYHRNCPVAHDTKRSSNKPAPWPLAVVLGFIEECLISRWRLQDIAADIESQDGPWITDYIRWSIGLLILTDNSNVGPKFFHHPAATCAKMDGQKFPHVDELQSSTASHEMGIVENAPTGMRRDLSRRHINMIGLAGMIVSCLYFAPYS